MFHANSVLELLEIARLLEYTEHIYETVEGLFCNGCKLENFRYVDYGLTHDDEDLRVVVHCISSNNGQINGCMVVHQNERGR